MDVVYWDHTVEEFIDSLERNTQTKVVKTLDLLSNFGHLLGMPHSKFLGSSLRELRIRGQQEIRIFYTFYRSRAVILYGFVKKTQQTPARELHVARTRLQRLTRT